MAGIVIVVIVAVGEAGAAEHCLAKMVRFNVLLECVGDTKTENIASAAEHCWILSAVRARDVRTIGFPGGAAVFSAY